MVVEMLEPHAVHWSRACLPSSWCFSEVGVGQLYLSPWGLLQGLVEVISSVCHHSRKSWEKRPRGMYVCMCVCVCLLVCFFVYCLLSLHYSGMVL